MREVKYMRIIREHHTPYNWNNVGSVCLCVELKGFNSISICVCVVLGWVVFRNYAL